MQNITPTGLKVLHTGHWTGLIVWVAWIVGACPMTVRFGSTLGAEGIAWVRWGSVIEAILPANSA